MSERKHYEVIVLGVGSMGSAACYFLAKRGHQVLGLEQYQIPHDKGSHAGQSRIVRKAYFEHPDYVPLLERAYHNWKLAELEAGCDLYYRTGLLYVGKPDNQNILGIRTSAEKYGIPIENMSSGEVRKRVPAFNLPDGFDAIFEPDAGFVTPERTVLHYTRAATALGAVVKKEVRVLHWKQTGTGVELFTEGAAYTCNKLIITAGAWSSQVIPLLREGLTVTKQVLAWVDTDHEEIFSFGKLPCWFIEDPERGTYYGFPELPTKKFDGLSGLKLAHHHPGEKCLANEAQQEIPSGAEEDIRYFLEKYLPHLRNRRMTMKTCLYTYSQDTNFIIDHLPGSDGRVTIACGFSGHGFKFVPVVGEILAELATLGKTDLPIDFLRLNRF